MEFIETSDLAFKSASDLFEFWIISGLIHTA